VTIFALFSAQSSVEYLPTSSITFFDSRRFAFPVPRVFLPPEIQFPWISCFSPKLGANEPGCQGNSHLGISLLIRGGLVWFCGGPSPSLLLQFYGGDFVPDFFFLLGVYVSRQDAGLSRISILQGVVYSFSLSLPFLNCLFFLSQAPSF